MYYQEATIKRSRKENKKKLKDGRLTTSITEIVRVIGVGRHSEFKDNEKVILMSEDDFNKLRECRQQVEILEEENQYLRKQTRPPNQELIDLFKAISKNNSEVMETTIKANDLTEQLIKSIAIAYDQQITEAVAQNKKDLDKIYNNVKHDIDKTNKEIEEVKKDVLSIVPNLKDSLAKEIMNTSRLKLLFNKNKLILNLDTTQITEKLEQIEQLSQLDIGKYREMLEGVLTMPAIAIDSTALKQEYNLGLDGLIIDLDLLEQSNIIDTEGLNAKETEIKKNV